MIVRGRVRWTEWRWILVASLVVVTASSVPYLAAWSRESPERVFSGCILLFEDCFSYLAKMRQGAEGAWLFHIPYTPEKHAGTLVYVFHLLLGKLAALLPGGDLTANLILVYHLARVIFGIGLLLTVYRFLAALTEQGMIRRLAWLMVAVGGGFGWLLAGMGKTRWLGNPPLDLYLAEGFAFMALYGFPHVAAAQSLLLGGFLCLLEAWGVATAPHERRSSETAQEDENEIEHSPHGRHLSRPGDHGSYRSSVRWAALTGLVWLAMGVIVPFYVAVAWAVMGAGWMVLAVREKGEEGSVRSLGSPAHPETRGGAHRSGEGTEVSGAPQDPKALSVSERLVLLARHLPWGKGALAGITVLISAPVVVYSAWVFTSDPVYAAWAAQNRILSPHPLHYVAAYGVPLALAAFAMKDVWKDEGPAWLALAWVVSVPLLVSLPINVQLRLLTGVQVPLSLLAAWGAARLWEQRGRWVALLLVALMIPTNPFLLASNSVWMIEKPPPSFRDGAEVAALDWLAGQLEPGDVILTSYDTGAYLPARVNARVLAGHDLEAVNAAEKKEEIDRFFDARTDDAWREEFLRQYGVEIVFWGPAERALGGFDPRGAGYLEEAYKAEGYAVFAAER